MFDSIRNIFSIPDLRRRVLYTFGLLAVYRLGSHIPTPGVDPRALEEFFKAMVGSLFGFLDIFSGGALRRLSVFALGIMPYISASIILQLLTVVWPYLEKLSKEGEIGRKKITQYTRYGTIVLSVIQSIGISIWLEKQLAPGGARLVPNPGVGFVLLTVLSLTTGTAFIMWLGEQVSERGIGNGISLIIYAGIVVAIVPHIGQSYQSFRSGNLDLFKILFLLLLMAAVMAMIVFVESGQRRIPVQYAKRVVGRRIYGGQNTYLPLRVNTSGVMAIIFAISVIQFPTYIAKMIGTDWARAVEGSLQMGHPLYILFYGIAIVFFTYFYTSVIFNPEDTAENLRKYGGFIPGIRPGRKTAEYIDNSLTRITALAVIYLIAIALLPDFLTSGFKVGGIPFIGAWLETNLPRWFTEGFAVQFYFGGTSILIVVGVAMDTMKQVEAQLVMRHYDGFMKKSRIRGRR